MKSHCNLHFLRAINKKSKVLFFVNHRLIKKEPPRGSCDSVAERTRLRGMFCPGVSGKSGEMGNSGTQRNST